MMRFAVKHSLQALWCAALAGAFLWITAAPTHAEAILFRFEETHTETFTDPLLACLPQEPVGTVTGTLTETSTGLVVDTGGKVFSVRGVNEFDSRVTLPDGMYVQSGPINRDRYVFVANAPQTVYHLVIQDMETIFAADGKPIGTFTIRAGFHITYNDVNGNGLGDPGEIASEFEYLRIHCG